MPYFALVALLTLAHADVPPADTEGCSGKAAGDACRTDAGEDGGCVTSTCSRLDYSNGTPPSSVQYECLLCDPSAKPAATICGVVDPRAALLPTALAAVLPLARRRSRQG